MLQSLWIRVAMIVLLAMLLSGCAVIGDIFKAGFWVGSIAVVVVVGGIVLVASMFRS
jgi:hypothetical protein